MSDVVKLRFYYGPSTVQTNELGADLSEFTHIEVAINAPQTWSVSQLKEWIAASLGLDTETHTVGVHALWTRSSSKIYFYLRPIEGDSDWVRWLQGCERRGCNPVALVLPVVKEVTAHEGEGGYEGQSSQVEGGNAYGYEPGQSSQVEGGNADGDYNGEVDADEVDGHMQNQMEEEDTDVERGHADDSDESDEEENVEEVPNPAWWNHDLSSAMTVNDGHDSAWQYHQNNIATGAMYPNKQALKDAIINWAMPTQRVFTAQVSSQKFLTMVCKNADFPTRVHGFLPKYGTSWVISDLLITLALLPTSLKIMPTFHPRLLLDCFTMR